MNRMQELYNKVATDSGLQQKFMAILKDAETAGHENKETTQEKLIAFAKEAGYSVTAEEIEEYFRTLVDKEKGGELSDSELDMVAGGKSQEGSLMVALSVLSAGVACVVGSIVQGIVYELNEKQEKCLNLWN